MVHGFPWCIKPWAENHECKTEVLCSLFCVLEDCGGEWSEGLKKNRRKGVKAQPTGEKEKSRDREGSMVVWWFFWGPAGLSMEVLSPIRGRSASSPCVRSQIFYKVKASDISSPFLLPPPLSLTSALSLSLLPWASLAGHGVAAMWVPLHVTNTSHRLELRMASAILVEVPVVTLLQQVLAATISRELVSHPAGG